ncbi:MAG: carbohydrate binding family 9 domain-containing protein, partial [Deltaproteobacteria bacterium]|nr:carbohydrate binding family 9 domain-containing protein [Deltaproteobacteria bacterium]
MKRSSDLFRSLIFCFFVFNISLPAWSFSEEITDPADQDSVLKQKNTIKQPVYTTSRLETEGPVIDGKLDDECWKHGTWAGDFHQWIPDEGAPPTFPTEFNIQYNDRNIYVAIRAYDGEPEKITRMSTGRDVYEGDVVGLSFDSYRDYRTGFEFHISAWGQKTDNILFNPMNWDTNWNAVWKGKSGMEDSAWVAEMEIPLSQLRYSREEEQVWGMHVWRWISRLSEESDWEIQTKTGPGMLFNFGELRGIKGLKPSRRIEIMPFVLGDLKTFEKIPENPFNSKGRDWGGNLGLDAKIGISSNFTIDLTVNPDFGQVESDPSVMNLTAFETFYEEKRPFFLEGLTIFDYDFDDKSLFYSRRIGHSPSLKLYPDHGYYVDAPDMTTILSALKFSGTTSKGLSVGLIQSITANEFSGISDLSGDIEKVKVEPLTSYTMARIRKGYNAGNTVIGGILTSTNRSIDSEDLEFLVHDAFTGGLDIRHHWRDKKYYVDARLVGSYVDGSREAVRLLQESSARYFQRPGADYLSYDTTKTTMEGLGGKIKVGKGSQGLWKYSTDISWISPGLELNDMGYMNEADEIRQENEVSFF